MTFEEEFVELTNLTYNKLRPYFLNGLFTCEEIREHCIEKERVKVAIMTVLAQEIARAPEEHNVQNALLAVKERLGL